MKTLKELQSGDKVILHKRNGAREVRIVRGNTGLINISETQSAYHFRDTGEPSGRYSTSQERIEVATPALIAEVEAENAEKLRKVEAAARQEQSDPRTPFVKRFRAGDFEPWEKLTLEQLQTIAKWLE